MNSRKGNFAKQAAILAGASILVRVIGFLYRLPLTNLLGDVGMGIYASGYTIYIFFLVLSSAGLPSAISKMVSERVSKGMYRNAHQVFRIALAEAAIIGFVASFILFVGAETFSKIVDSPDSYLAILTLIPTIFIVAVMAVFRGYFQGMKTSAPTAISQIVEQIFNAVFSVWLAYILAVKTNNMAMAAAGGTAGTGIGALAGLVCLLLIYVLLAPIFYKKIKKDIFSENYESKKDIAIEVLKTSFPIIIGTAIFSITNLIDLKMVNSGLLELGYTRDQVDAAYGILTGKYVTLTTLPVSISTALATVAVPAIASSLAVGHKRDANNKINMALRLGMIFSFPAAMGICFLADPILLLLFPNHPDGGFMLQLGSFSIIFLSIAQIATGVLQGASYVKIPVFGAFCGAIVKIILNYILISIPDINVYGAVISTTACYLVASAVDLYFLKKIMGKGTNLHFKSGFMKPLIASLLMGFSCYIIYNFVYLFIKSNGFSCIIAIIFGMIVYLAFMIFIKGILKKDLMILPLGNRLIIILNRFGVNLI